MKTEKDRYIILLVEDSGSDAFAVKRVLKKFLPHPCFIMQAENMEDAEKMLGEIPEIDLILLDLHLPDTDCQKDTFERLKAANSEIPVVVLTGMKDYALAVKVVNDGAQEFFDKALIAQRPEILCDIVEFTIGRYRKDRQRHGDQPPAAGQAG